MNGKSNNENFLTSLLNILKPSIMKIKRSTNILNLILSGILLFVFLLSSSFCHAGDKDIYQIKIYSIENEQQELRMDKFLKEAYIPALHRAGISKVGVFKTIEDKEKTAKLIYVFVPFESLSQFEKLEAVLNNDKKFLKDGNDYIYAAHDNAPYQRIESILLRAFESMPEYGVPDHTTPPSERVYELRSYQGPTEKLYGKKVEQFNIGGVLKLFMDLDFQPVFHGEVISGSDMPNLMYMTTFENKASQDEHWNAFRTSEAWATIKADTQYKNTVSKSEKFYLYPTDYSGL